MITPTTSVNPKEVTSIASEMPEPAASSIRKPWPAAAMPKACCKYWTRQPMPVVLIAATVVVELKALAPPIWEAKAAAPKIEVQASNLRLRR